MNDAKIIRKQSKEMKEEKVCPENFIKLGNSCYKFSTNDDTWHDAYHNCIDLQSHLISIDSNDEDTTIRKYLRSLEQGKFNGSYLFRI